MARHSGRGHRDPRPLAARLTARFPDIDTRSDAEEDDVWTDGPLAGHADAPVFGIGVTLQPSIDRLLARIRDLGCWPNA